MKALLIVLLLSTLGSAAELETPTRVVCSVARIATAQPAHRDFVSVHLSVHSPSELAGATFVLATDSKDRARIRKQMPLGSLHEVILPAKLASAVKKQREHQERIEKIIDGGTPPEMISDMVPLTEVQLADLSKAIAPFPLK